jgi:selenophosphate synthase
MSGAGQVLIIDTNVFVTAHRLYYPFDFALPFWDFLENAGANGDICSIDKVYDELSNGNDPLADWAINSSFQNCFKNTQTRNILTSYATLVNHVQGQPQYTSAAKREFMRANNADSWLLAYAHATNAKIVTLEKFDPNIRRKVQIPNICQHFNIDYCDTFDMLRELGFSFKRR